jgi:hypothetical protein
VNRLNWPAIRAFNKAWQPHAIAHEEGWRCDRHFDGGEWSDGAHATLEQDHMERVATVVAARYGMCTSDLLDSLLEAEYHSMDHIIDSLSQGDYHV